MAKVIALPPRKVRKHTEGVVLAEIRARAAHLPWCVCWRSNTGALEDATGRKVYFGLCEGASDLVGIVRVLIDHRREGQVWAESLGRFFALEVKAPGKEPTPAQYEFLDLVRKMGGAAAWCDNADDGLAFLERAREPRHDR